MNNNNDQDHKIDSNYKPFDKFMNQYQWGMRDIYFAHGPIREVYYNPRLEEMKDRVSNLPNDEKIRLAIELMFGADLILTLEDALQDLSDLGFKMYHKGATTPLEISKKLREEKERKENENITR